MPLSQETTMHMVGGSGGDTASSPEKKRDNDNREQAAVSPFRASLQRLRRRRRPRSAPPALRTPLLGHHYRVDRDQQLIVLPGVPKHEEDWHRDAHDFFNLIVLIPIISLNVMNWNWDRLFNLRKKETIADAWTGEWFDLFLAATLLYFVVDLIWILCIPKCVKSPSTILQHHVVTMLYILIPFYRPHVRWCMGACMSVEMNTWFLIARRVFNKQGFPPWIIDLSIVSIRVKLISICFYVTWIGLRCILYPLLLVYLLQTWLEYSSKIGTYFNIELIGPVLHSSFCILNFKWTYELTMSKIRYYKRRRRANPTEEEQISKGL